MKLWTPFREENKIELVVQRHQGDHFYETIFVDATHVNVDDLNNLWIYRDDQIVGACTDWIGFRCGENTEENTK